MKKFFFILLCLFVTLTGCSGYKKSSAVTAVTTGLSFTAEISYEESSYCYFVEVGKDGKIRMQSRSEQSDTQTDYMFYNSTVTYIYNELEYSTDISAIPQSSVIDLIPAVLTEAGKAGNNVNYKKEQFFLTGKTPKYNFTLFFGQSGLPIKITETQLGISVIIKNPTLIS